MADVYIGSSTGALVSREIITNGYGWVYRKGIKSKPYASLIKSESLAKRSKIGLWSKDTCAGKRMPSKEVASSGSTTIIQSSGTSSVQSVETNITPTQFSCSNVPRYCTGVKTREEAQFYLNSCGATKFDRDNDGIACEDIK